MEHADVRIQKIRGIPRHHARELSVGERVGITLVALLGSTGVLGTSVIAWWLALL